MQITAETTAKDWMMDFREFIGDTSSYRPNEKRH
jgi:hypothetical protein